MQTDIQKNENSKGEHAMLLEVIAETKKMTKRYPGLLYEIAKLKTESAQLHRQIRALEMEKEKIKPSDKISYKLVYSNGMPAGLVNDAEIRRIEREIVEKTSLRTAKQKRLKELEAEKAELEQIFNDLNNIIAFVQRNQKGNNYAEDSDTVTGINIGFDNSANSRRR